MGDVNETSRLSDHYVGRLMFFYWKRIFLLAQTAPAAVQRVALTLPGED